METIIDRLPTLLVLGAIIITCVAALLAFRSRKMLFREMIVKAIIVKQEEQVKDLYGKVSALEHGKAAESIGEEVLNQLSDRLAKVEQTIEPLKGKPQFSSPEFNLLLYEIEKIGQDMSSRQGSFEGSHNNKFASFRFNFTIFLVVVTVLLSLAIYFLTIRGA